MVQETVADTILMAQALPREGNQHLSEKSMNNPLRWDQAPGFHKVNHPSQEEADVYLQKCIHQKGYSSLEAELKHRHPKHLLQGKARKG
jgi:hypothetical protein